MSVENQTEAGRRIPILLSVPAYRHWLSVEQMLGRVDLSRWLATGLIHFVVIGDMCCVGAGQMRRRDLAQRVQHARRARLDCRPRLIRQDKVSG